eukprot:3691217-Alexandrium_andersonii.AAC.1
MGDGVRRPGRRVEVLRQREERAPRAEGPAHSPDRLRHPAAHARAEGQGPRAGKAEGRGTCVVLRPLRNVPQQPEAQGLPLARARQQEQPWCADHRPDLTENSQRDVSVDGNASAEASTAEPASA